MLRKIWAITWKELYTTFTDRNLILIMILTPLALATIIGMAFSGFINTSNDVPIRDIPVAVVNLDQGTDVNGTTVNSGQTFVDVLAPSVHRSNNALDELLNATRLLDADAARAEVDKGAYAAAVIIPADFSAKLSYSRDHSIEPVSVEVYASPTAAISATVVRSIVESIANQIATGSITVEATIEALIARAQSDPTFGLRFGAASASGDFQPDFSAAFDAGGANPISIDQQTVTGEAATFNPLVLFGSAQAVFFMLFTAMGGANSLLEERRDGTLQRLIVSPTPRMAILLGKLLGTFVTCVVQVTILVIALTLVGSVIAGELQFIWGSDVFALALLIITVALAASGLATVVAALVRTPEQGNMIGGVISMAEGVLGGAFFGMTAMPEALRSLANLTVVWWGTDAFAKLAVNQNDIGQNLLILLVMGVVLFVVGLVIFSRRLDA